MKSALLKFFNKYLSLLLFPLFMSLSPPKFSILISLSSLKSMLTFLLFILFIFLFFNSFLFLPKSQTFFLSLICNFSSLNMFFFDLFKQLVIIGFNILMFFLNLLSFTFIVLLLILIFLFWFDIQFLYLLTIFIACLS